jgi:hypothetical protein
MEPNSSQFFTLRDCLARRLVARTNAPDSADAADDLGEVAHFLALELWSALPASLHEATYETRTSVPDPESDALPLAALPVAFGDTLVAYGLASDGDGALALARRVLADFVADACAPPPVWSATRADACELCERDVSLTYHHLIPRSTHARVLKKRWHPESQLNSVAWLCRSVVHISLRAARRRC